MQSIPFLLWARRGFALAAIKDVAKEAKVSVANPEENRP